MIVVTVIFVVDIARLNIINYINTIAIGDDCWLLRLGYDRNWYNGRHLEVVIVDIVSRVAVTAATTRSGNTGCKLRLSYV